MKPTTSTHHNFTAPSTLCGLLLYVLIVNGLWLLWVFLMMLYPNPFANNILRAVARVSIILIPAVVFIRRVEQQPLLDYLRLRHNAGWGILVGSVVAIMYGLYLGIVICFNTTVIANRYHSK